MPTKTVRYIAKKAEKTIVSGQVTVTYPECKPETEGMVIRAYASRILTKTWPFLSDDDARCYVDGIPICRTCLGQRPFKSSDGLIFMQEENQQQESV